MFRPILLERPGKRDGKSAWRLKAVKDGDAHRTVEYIVKGLRTDFTHHELWLALEFVLALATGFALHDFLLFL
jgi:hypothetical protein